jgi:hypothetical protein
MGSERSMHRGGGLSLEVGGGSEQKPGDQGRKENNAWRHGGEPTARPGARV